MQKNDFGCLGLYITLKPILFTFGITHNYVCQATPLVTAAIGYVTLHAFLFLEGSNTPAATLKSMAQYSVNT